MKIPQFALPARLDRLIHRGEQGSSADRPLPDANVAGPRHRRHVAGSGTVAPRREGVLLHARLPDELTLKVLEQLDPESLLQFAQSSRATRDFVKHTPQLRAALAAMSKEAREVGGGRAEAVAQDLGKVRRAKLLFDEDLLQPLVKDLVASLRTPRALDNHLERQDALAALAGVLIGIGKLGDEREKELAKAIAKATPEDDRPRVKLMDRSTFMARALAHVESDDPARYKRLTNRLFRPTVQVWPIHAEDKQRLARLPEPVLSKVNRFRAPGF